MHQTTNSTTWKYGAASATVIADSASPTGKRITTLECVYPRFIHAELMTHRMFSRNAASSRATPVDVMIREVKENPVVLSNWRKNQPGMSGGELLPGAARRKARAIWLSAKEAAVQHALKLKELGCAKEHVNRVLEPFAHIRTLVTATEWENFFGLRLDAAHVQPEMYDLACAMHLAMQTSKPKESCAHLPYITESDTELVADADMLARISAARCARVSYLTHDGKEPSIQKDLDLADQLLKNGHLSPFEHPAGAIALYYASCANFRGWLSYRHYLDGVKKGVYSEARSESWFNKVWQ